MVNSIAFSFAYSQKEHKTIEGQLFSALVKIGSVSEDNSDDPVSFVKMSAQFWLAANC
jgi:tRNA U38,U39,U40 pseudouridine synthase TruA